MAGASSERVSSDDSGTPKLCGMKRTFGQATAHAQNEAPENHEMGQELKQSDGEDY